MSASSSQRSLVVTLRHVELPGQEALAALTRLLQRVRLEDPIAGIWEPADLAWWKRMPRASDEVAQDVWLDASGDPVAAVMWTAWSQEWWCDPIVLPSRQDELLPMLLEAADERLRGWNLTGPLAMAVRDTDVTWQQLAEAHGFAADPDQRYAVLWMDAVGAQAPTPVAEGYALSDRSERAHLPHHYIGRSPEDVADRLAASPLYATDRDLCIVTDDGEVVGHGLFWFDPVTKLGMVEPMRTEDGHMGKGLARAILTEGLARLVAAGAERLKIAVEVGNAPAEHLYTSAGFVPTVTDTAYIRNL